MTITKPTAGDLPWTATGSDMIDALNGVRSEVSDQVKAWNNTLGYGVAGITSGFQTIYNTGNGAYPTLTSVSQSGTTFTSGGIQVPAAGVYLCIASAYFSGGGTGQCQQFITKNTTTAPPPAGNRLNGGVQIWKGDGNDYTSNASVIATLAANDIVRLYMNANFQAWGSTGIDGTSLTVRCLSLT